MNDGYLAHHGILGMKWGIRRYQNPDGTRTEEGKRRYALNEKSTKQDVKLAFKAFGNENFRSVGKKYSNALKNDKELKSLNKQIKSEKRELDRTVRQLRYRYDDDDRLVYMHPEVIDRRNTIYELNRKITDREGAISERWVEKFNDARLKDLHYSGDLKIGRKILEDYGGVYYYRGGFMRSTDLFGIHSYWAEQDGYRSGYIDADNY